MSTVVQTSVYREKGGEDAEAFIFILWEKGERKVNSNEKNLYYPDWAKKWAILKFARIDCPIVFPNLMANKSNNRLLLQGYYLFILEGAFRAESQNQIMRACLI